MPDSPPERLDRIDRHFQGYVDQKKLAGWHIAISRKGQLVHSSTSGHRDIATDLPFTDDTVVRMFSMTKPITSVAAMMLYEEGLSNSSHRSRSGCRSSPTRGSTGRARSSRRLPIRSSSRSGSGTCSPTRRASPTDSTTPTSPTIYRRGGFEWGNPPGADLAECCACGRPCHSCSSPAPNGTTGCRPTCSAVWSRSCRGCRSTSSSAPGSSSRSA